MLEEIAADGTDRAFLSRLIGEQNTTIGMLEAERNAAQAFETYWKQQHADAWTRIGRIDYALEKIALAKSLRDARGWAVKMRREIKAAIAELPKEDSHV